MIRNVNWAALASLTIILGLEAIVSKPITAQASVEPSSPSVIEQSQPTDTPQESVEPSSPSVIEQSQPTETPQESPESPSPSVIELLEQTEPSQPAETPSPTEPSQPAETPSPTEPSQPAETPGPEAQTSESDTLIAVATQTEQLNLFLQAVKAADLEETLTQGGPYTIFAPTDTAFEQLPEDVLTTLLQPENQPILRQILMYHVVSEKIMAKDLSSGELTSLGGGLSLQVSEDTVVVNDGTVVAKDLEANNGVIHLVNRVLIPEDIRSRLESTPSDTQK